MQVLAGEKMLLSKRVFVSITALVSFVGCIAVAYEFFDPIADPPVPVRIHFQSPKSSDRRELERIKYLLDFQMGNSKQQVLSFFQKQRFVPMGNAPFLVPESIAEATDPAFDEVFQVYRWPAECQNKGREWEDGCSPRALVVHFRFRSNRLTSAALELGLKTL